MKDRISVDLEKVKSKYKSVYSVIDQRDRFAQICFDLNVNMIRRVAIPWPPKESYRNELTES